jgi:choline dehydrogenase-like flavoprotein
MTTFDTIVVGSGATGAMAAQTLVEGGGSVLMLDAGLRDDRYAPLIPPKNFVDIRREEHDQYRYFLGDELDAARFRKLGAGAQLTPPRRYVAERVDEFAPLRSSNFTPVESLALGGLGAAWGLLCGAYSDAELERASLPVAPMRAAYQIVADRIGISGAAGDDARPYTYGDLTGIQPPVPLDPTAAVLAARYERRRDRFLAADYRLGRPALALLTRDRDGRGATQLRDMDFYSDAERAAWRPWMTVESLLRAPNFAYAGGAFVTRFDERDDAVEVVAFDLRTREEARFHARRLVLAAGVLSTARIVLRSAGAPGARVPLLCNAYTYVPCLVPQRVGKAMPDRNLGLVQLIAAHDPHGAHCDVAIATVFSYRSLLLFRLLREMPLPVRDARALMQYLLSGFLIVGIDHPQARSEGKAAWLERADESPTSDALTVDYALTAAEQSAFDARERSFMRALRDLGAWPIKRVRPPLGASIHYAGTLPFEDGDRPLHLDRSGRLHGTRCVYVADGSGFTYLPAKGLTLSLMANAHLVAERLAARP